ncbi:MAG: dTDP-4-dehydrorhamnose reductase [Desulfomonilia bacterium]|jgi:dTDP-4-dehydrorhamnose reductase|uniref:dTDP-4-dehydrorhamnose reductase n=1 Tax=anaerobic digester metagenome TaxID=1263854 RepID=A0A485LZW5_9ZZZZ|nr:dTDP-4-dehydrorhamnose reductase [Pseudomonadota bacterium]HPD20206.1 dTDP-4-dehydrorhamnose reductase [Deltaproteobacteria bacterium]HPX19228.1 dTDP-4-dehydrorhamnose reductase [Deltaproteobacteria bacterium]HRS57210.1 dTDP-4-dehydrorhamnose reductase [Desulfomonilia bacterium]HRV34924.1 dTDP-4-dehydrorhamnose reductase [Desulfomonilia bacterium]
MKILITGSQGLLGQEVVEVCRNRGDEVLATDIASSAAPLDITSPAAVRGFLASNRPDWVVNCAAFTDVDGCEGREDLAFELNARAPGHLARACEEHGAKLLHISTDYVFDGEKSGPYEEDDEPNPLSVYGKSKRAGEISVQEGVEHYLIVRTQWLFGPHGRNFVSTILGLAQERDTLSVVNDQWGSPTYSKDLARALRVLIDCDARGVFHVRNRGKATWFDLARHAINLLGLPTQVVPVDTSAFPRPARRPMNGLLSTRRFTRITGKVMPSWQISLKSYIKEYLHEQRRESRD